MKFFNYFLIFIFVFAFSVTAGGDQGGSIIGKVTDTFDVSLADVEIRIPQLDRETATDKYGLYRFENIPAGTYLVKFQFYGYASTSRKITVPARVTVTLEVKLQLVPLEMHTITVTGTPYICDPLSASPDTDILTGREKMDRQSSALGASLEKMPGVTNISTGLQVGKPVIRGQNSNRIRILTDGIGMDYQQYGVRHWPNVDPFLMESIEVVRGASCVLYGSDAMGGVVNMIPRHIPSYSEGEFFLRGDILTEYYSNNSERVGGLTLDGAYGSLGWTSSIIGRKADNLTVPNKRTSTETGIGTDPKFTGELDYTDFEQFNWSLGIGYQARFGKIFANYYRWSDEHNFLLPDGQGVGQNIGNDTFQLNGLFPLGNNWILKLTSSFLKNLRQSNKEGSPRNKLPGDIVIDLLLKNYDARFVLEHGPIGPVAGQFGFEYVYSDQDTRGEVPLVPTAKIRNFASFAYEEAQLDSFSLSFGARVDIRSQRVMPNEVLRLPDYDAGETDEVLRQNYSVFSGAVGLVYRLSENLAIAGNIGRGFRAPSIFELHVYGVHGGIAAFQIGDPFMREETSMNTDLSLRWQSPRIQAKGTIYHSNFDNYIYLINTGEFFQESSGSQVPIMKTIQGDAVMSGADFSVQAQVLDWLQLRGAVETVSGRNIDTGEKLPLLPATKTWAELRCTRNAWGPLENFFLSLGLRHAAKKDAAGRYEPFWQFDQNPNFGVASTGAYTLCDFGLGFDVLVGGQNFGISLMVNNLFDTAYRDFLDTYKGYALSPGRDVILKLIVPFNIGRR
jgi:iron complex outermembrane receptor protein